MVAIIVAEKPSAARNMAAALGGTTGQYKGVDYEIASLRGHLYEYVEPARQVSGDLVERYKMWSLANLPWTPEDLAWQREAQKNVSDVIPRLRAALQRGDEIVCATDLDPTGEGDLLFWEAVDELGFTTKRFSRMEFTDESTASIQKAFVSRRKIISMQDEGAYRKAVYRARFDYLSMQWTRVATVLARSSGKDVVLRQGRLKSAMVRLVGDQLKAYHDYVKKPFFQNRFKDENGVTYINADEPRFDSAEQVPATYQASAVVFDGSSNKRTAPPKLLDLSALAALLSGRGVKAQAVTDCYQKMYEDQVVSYPRTEDKTITGEQFKELLPLVDKIAGVVGVDPSLLTHRVPRKTHVKDQGAHGANRPGPKVPASMAALTSAYGPIAPLIYDALAKSYLAMLADDYVYEHQEGHVADYPEFKGAANVPRSWGWKLVFNADADEPDATDDDENPSGIGEHAEPFVFEGANKRPEHPTMKWLMKQLEKRDVGTGATRTSTYAEVTKAKAKYPLLSETKGKLTMSECGQMSYLLLPGTRIGDLSLTEDVYANMRDIDAGTKTAASCLAVVADWVSSDIEQMQLNATAMRSELGLTEVAVKRERHEGTWAKTGQTVRFSKSWGGHAFTDDELQRLLAGEEISFAATAKSGKGFTAKGRLEEFDFKGRRVVGFQRTMPQGPTQWCKHTFTGDEKARLMAGEKLKISGFVSAKGNTFDASVRWDKKASKIEAEFLNDPNTPPGSWCKHTFTDDELDQLRNGQTIFIEGFVSAKGRTFDAKVRWGDEGGKKKIIPEFG